MDNEGGNEPSGSLPTISSLAHSCHAAFSKLCQELPSTEYYGLEPEATDEAGRFTVWASNIGALQKPQSLSSLDSRLTKAERMKNNVVSGLQRLENALKRANEIALGSIPNRTSKPATAGEIIRYSVGTVVGSNDERDHEFTTEINELFNNVQSCITYLFTLSTLLRRSHPRGRTSQQGPQSSQSDPGPLITNAKDKFPKLKQSPWLAERIGQRTARQMDYIRYRQNHRTKLARIDVGLMKDELAERATTKATSFHDTIATPESIKQPTSGSSQEESIYTVATSFAQTAVGDTYSGRIVPQLTDMWLDGRQLGYGEPVECPYCRTIQILKDRYHWKHHVYCDLQTYVCSFEHCSEGPFQTSHEWFKHEVDKHRRQWKCVLCHAKCSSASALESHFNSQHPSVVSATQRKVMLKACEKPLNHFDTDSCLLCDNWSPSSETEGNSNKFRSHLAKHYQDLACEAIPLDIEGLEIKAADDVDDDSALSEDDEHRTTGGDINSAHTVLVGKAIGKNKVWRCVQREVDGGRLCPATYPLCAQLFSHFQEEHQQSDHDMVLYTICARCGRIRSEDRCGCGDAVSDYDEWAIADKPGSHTQPISYLETRLKARLEAVARLGRGPKYRKLEGATARLEASNFEMTLFVAKICLELESAEAEVEPGMESRYERMKAVAEMLLVRVREARDEIMGAEVTGASSAGVDGTPEALETSREGPPVVCRQPFYDTSQLAFDGLSEPARDQKTGQNHCSH
ncbi:hypothetical protein LZ30DRAFT_253565 [Colletotrichum cereale]|nr:hypothetical protein LZ30DRAFT_253565 [Colletotrichum cereale]